MTVGVTVSRRTVTLDGECLTPAAVAKVAGGQVSVQLSSAARARNAAARAAVEQLVAAERPLYGVTTGVGALRDRRVAPRDAVEHQRRLVRSHAAAAGEPLDAALVRGAMTVRLNQLGAGGA